MTSPKAAQIKTLRTDGWFTSKLPDSVAAMAIREAAKSRRIVFVVDERLTELQVPAALRRARAEMGPGPCGICLRSGLTT